MRKTKNEVLEGLKAVGVIACMQDSFSQEKSVEAAGALLEVGFNIFEFTMYSQNPVENMKAVKAAYGDRCIVGMGTVLTVEEAQIVMDAGADFLMAPCYDEEVFAYVNNQDISMIPGVFTASEVVKATKAGAEIVKLFPVGHIGVEYLSAVRGPLSKVNIFCDGRVPYGRVKDFIAAGAVGCGQMAGLLGDGTDTMEVIQERAVALSKEIEAAKLLRK